MIDINLDEVKQIIEKHRYRRVLVLLPAGLMPVADSLEIPEPIFFATPCYGACDVPLHLLHQFDAIFNFGHSNPGGYPENVHFFEVQVRVELPEFIPPFDKVGLVYIIQYKDMVEKYAEVLRKSGKEVILGGKPEFMATYNGQVTGCDTRAAKSILDKIEGFVVAADGVFHAGAVAALGKQTFNWNGEEASAPKYPMAALFMAKRIGILIGTKPGQSFIKEAEEVRNKLERQGKQVLTVLGDTITLDVKNLPVDFWVVAACPRLAEDEHLSPAAPVKEVLNAIQA